MVGGHVAEDDHLDAVANVLGGPVADVVDGTPDPLGPVRQGVTRGDGGLLEPPIFLRRQGGDALHLVGVKDGTLQVYETRTPLGNLVYALLLPQSHGEAHHHALAERVDGGIRHLREPLLEVIVGRVRPLAQYREGGVVPHRVGRLLPATGHVLYLHPDVLETPPEGPLRERGGGIVVQSSVAEYHLGDVLAPPCVPLAVGVTPGDLGLDSDVVLEFPRLQVDVDHGPRSQSSLGDDVGLVQIHHARLAHHVHRPVLGDGVPRRAQAVPVEGRADRLPVRVHQ